MDNSVNEPICWTPEQYYRCPKCEGETKFTNNIDNTSVTSLATPAIYRSSVWSCKQCKLLFKLVPNYVGNGIVYNDETKMFTAYFNNNAVLTRTQRRNNFGSTEEISAGWVINRDSRRNLSSIEIINMDIPAKVLQLMPREFILEEIVFPKKKKSKSRKRGKKCN